MVDRNGKKKKNIKTDEELKQIALDLYSGRIFCDRHISADVLKRDPHFIKMVFMTLCFMDSKWLGRLRKEKANFFYEYWDKAGPRGINGYPSFISMRYLKGEETKRMFEFYNKIKSGVDEALNLGGKP